MRDQSEQTRLSVTPASLIQSHHMLSALTATERQRLLALATTKRYRPGDWPTSEPKAFDPQGTVTIYEEVPPDEKPPDYPPPPH